MLKCRYADTANCTVRNCMNTLLAVRCQAKHSRIHKRIPLTGKKPQLNRRCRYEHWGALLSPQLIIVVWTDTEGIRLNPEECRVKMLQLGLFFTSLHVSKAAGLTLHHHLFISTSTDSVTTAKDGFSWKTGSQIDPNHHVVKWPSFQIISNIPNTDYL